jgi:pSer/pThr/pTyr-binding forkhead associated (FHA) protein
MTTNTYPPGHIIFKENDPSNEVYLVRSGRVEVSMLAGDKPVILNQLGPGEVFGELGLFDEKPRSATIKTLETTELDVLTREEAGRLVTEKAPELIPFLQALFERLRNVSNRLRIEMQKNPGTAGLPQLASLYDHGSVPAATAAMKAIIEPISAKAKKSCGQDRIEVAEFPYRIGRASEHGQPDPFHHNNLLLHDEPPLRISRAHCALEFERNQLVLRDRGSSLGTIADNEPLGVEAGRLSIPMTVGVHEIKLGDEDSPYTFRVTIAAAV